jgi:hypothetical protein
MVLIKLMFRHRVLDDATGTTGMEELARKIHARTVTVACVRRVYTSPATSAHPHAPFPVLFGAYHQASLAHTPSC